MPVAEHSEQFPHQGRHSRVRVRAPTRSRLQLEFSVAQWRLLALSLVPVLLLATYTLLAPSLYTADTVLELLDTASAEDVTGAGSWREAEIRTAAYLSTSPAVIDNMLAGFSRPANVTASPSSLDSPLVHSALVLGNRTQVRLDAKAIPETRLMSLSVTAADPILARDISNAAAENFIEYLDIVQSRAIETARVSVGRRLQSLLEGGAQQSGLNAPLEVIPYEAFVSETAELSHVQRETDGFTPWNPNTPNLTQLYQRLDNALLDGLVNEFGMVVSGAARWSILSPAELPQETVRLWAPTPWVLALVSGVLAAGIMLVIPLYRRNTVRFAEELESNGAEWELAAVLPELDSDILTKASSDLSLPADKTYTESMRCLRSAIQLKARREEGQGMLAQHNPGRMIVVTASAHGDGTSAFARHFALCLGQVDRVLLIDATLRASNAGTEFCGLPPGTAGLSHLIAGAAQMRDCIHALDKEGIHVMPAGVIPPNPQELLASKRLDKILTVLSRRYDYIIIDAPPLAMGSDASLLARQATDIVYLVRAEHTKISTIEQTVSQLLTLPSAPAPMLVLNRANESNAVRYGHTKHWHFADQTNTYAYRKPGKRILTDH